MHHLLIERLSEVTFDVIRSPHAFGLYLLRETRQKVETWVRCKSVRLVKLIEDNCEFWRYNPIFRKFKFLTPFDLHFDLVKNYMYAFCSNPHGQFNNVNLLATLRSFRDIYRPCPLRPVLSWLRSRPVQGLISVWCKKWSNRTRDAEPEPEPEPPEPTHFGRSRSRSRQKWGDSGSEKG